MASGRKIPNTTRPSRSNEEAMSSNAAKTEAEKVFRDRVSDDELFRQRNNITQSYVTLEHNRLADLEAKTRRLRALRLEKAQQPVNPSKGRRRVG
jgi:hypothetical protein